MLNQPFRRFFKRSKKEKKTAKRLKTVSYTHLTLPTIYSV